MGIFRWLFGLPPKLTSSTPSGFPSQGIIGLDEFPKLLALRAPQPQEFVLVTIFRQSGNLERREQFLTRDEAMRAAQKLFRRMKQTDARIWQNTTDTVDIRRSYYNGRGRSEGKVILGVVIEILPLAPLEH